jgi:hypothetical protein
MAPLSIVKSSAIPPLSEVCNSNTLPAVMLALTVSESTAEIVKRLPVLTTPLTLIAALPFTNESLGEPLVQPRILKVPVLLTNSSPVVPLVAVTDCTKVSIKLPPTPMPVAACNVRLFPLIVLPASTMAPVFDVSATLPEPTAPAAVTVLVKLKLPLAVTVISPAFCASPVTEFRMPMVLTDPP